MKYILLILSVLILTGCGSTDNVVDNRDVVCEIDESEIPVIEKEVVVTETEIVYVDRPLGVSDEEMKFYIWFTLQAVEDLEEEGRIIRVVDDDTIRVENEDEGYTDYDYEEWLDILYDYYDYMRS